MHVTIIGCGWLGFPLAKKLVSLKYSVHGSSTTDTKWQVFRESGIQPFLCNDREIQLPKEVLDAEVAIVCIPPSKSNDYTKLLSDLVVQFPGTTHFIFTSSTSVYQGVGILNESSPIQEDSKMALAESCFRPYANRTTILRLAGLIGEGRHPGKFLSGKQIHGGGMPVNLIHLEDVLAALTAVVQNPKCGIFNLCYPEHPRKVDYYTKKASELDLAPPNFLTMESDGKQLDGMRFTVEYPFQYNHKI